MRKYTEEKLAAAITAVQNGQSLHGASKEYGIPRSTLHDRTKGSEDIRTAHEHQQRLSNTDEKRLVDWALVQGKLGLPPTQAQLHYFAQRIIQDAGDDKPLGKHWIRHFIARNPSLNALWDKSLQRPYVKKPMNNPPIAQEPAATPSRTPPPAQSLTELPTPRKSSDLRPYRREILKKTPRAEWRTVRLLFREMGRCLDAQNAKCAMLLQERLELEAAIEATRAQRRRQAYNDLNKHFAAMKQALESRDVTESQPEDFNGFVFEDMCQEWSIYED